MLHFRTVLLGLAALAVTACGPLDSVTRQVPFETSMLMVPAVIGSETTMSDAPEIVSRAAPELSAAISAPGYNVVSVQIDVPRSLRVSESNLLIPLGDIVWRGDLPGDRYAQVQAILKAAFERGTAGFNGGQDIVVHATVTRFHSLSQRARYSIGGNHSIIFDLTLIDARTGQPISETQSINASFDAFGGQQAIEAEIAGLTQKIRITDHVANVIYAELEGQQGLTQMASAGF